jgi:hypothetical protein
MEIKKIIDYVNRSFIASDYVREPDVYYYMDLVIDDINERLQAKFPTFTEWGDFVNNWNKQISSANRPDLRKYNTVYDAFPDKYLRTVVALGTAVKFYTRDEEGEQIALDYQNRYEGALFKMQRDYLNQVPEYFQDNTGGYIDFSYTAEAGPDDLIPRGVTLHGIDTRVL